MASDAILNFFFQSVSYLLGNIQFQFGVLTNIMDQSYCCLVSKLCMNWKAEWKVNIWIENLNESWLYELKSWNELKTVV